MALCCYCSRKMIRMSETQEGMYKAVSWRAIAVAVSEPWS